MKKVLTVLLILTAIALWLVSNTDFNGTILNDILVFWLLILMSIVLLLNKRKK